MWVLAQRASTGQTLPAPCLEGPMLGSTVLCYYSEILNFFFIKGPHIFILYWVPQICSLLVQATEFYMLYVLSAWYLSTSEIVCFTCLLVFHCLLQTEEKLLNRKHLVCLESLCR